MMVILRFHECIYGTWCSRAVLLRAFVSSCIAAMILFF